MCAQVYCQCTLQTFVSLYNVNRAQYTRPTSKRQLYQITYTFTHFCLFFSFFTRICHPLVVALWYIAVLNRRPCIFSHTSARVRLLDFIQTHSIFHHTVIIFSRWKVSVLNVPCGDKCRMYLNIVKLNSNLLACSGMLVSVLACTGCWVCFPGCVNP